MTSKVRLKLLCFIACHLFLFSHGEDTAPHVKVLPLPQFKFTEEPPRTVLARRGQRLALPCAGSSADGALVTVQWYCDGALVADSTDDGKIISHDLNDNTPIPQKRRRLLSGNYSLLHNGSLLIGSATTAHKVFQCFISTSGASYRHQRLASPRCHLILYDSPSFSVVPTSQSKIEGESLRFSCRSAASWSSPPLPPLTYSWHRNHAILPQSKRYLVLPGVLQILNVTSSDAGFYSCRANNSIETATTHDAMLSVQRANDASVFTWVNVTSDVKAEIGTELILECLASMPRHLITYTWMRNGKEFCTSDVGCIKKGGNIIIPHASLEHNGIVECVASCNNVTHRKMMNVTVYSKPQITLEEHLELQIGTTKNILCPVTANPPATVWWMRNGHRIPYLGESGVNLRLYAKKTPNSGKDVLHFFHFKYDYEGLYQCVAENDHGYTISTVNITVSKYEHFPAPYNLKATDVTKNSMRVSFSGAMNPLVTLVTWMEVDFIKKDGKVQVKTGKVPVSDNVDGNCSVTITDLDAYTNYSLFAQYYNSLSSLESETIYVRTSECVPSTYAQKDKVIILGSSELVVSWFPITGKESCGRIIYYTVEYSPLDVANPPVRRLVVRVTDEMRNSKLLYAHLKYLQPDKEYHISIMPATRVGSYKAGGNGDTVRQKTERIPQDLDCQPRANGLQIEANFTNETTNTLLVSWVHNTSIKVEGYRLSVVDYNNISKYNRSLPLQVKTATIPSIDRLQMYKITLHVHSSFNKTCLKISTAIFPGAQPYISKPRITSATSLSTTEIEVHWVFHPDWYPDQPVQHFEVCCSEDHRKHCVNSTGRTARVSGLQPATMYEVSVRAVFAKSVAERKTTPFSIARAVMTKRLTPLAPTRLVPMQVGQAVYLTVEDDLNEKEEKPTFLLEYNCTHDGIVMVKNETIQKGIALKVTCLPLGAECHMQVARVIHTIVGHFQSMVVTINEASNECGTTELPSTTTTPRDQQSETVIAVLIGMVILLAFIVVVVVLLYCCCRHEMVENAKCIWCKKSVTNIRHCNTRSSSTSRLNDNRSSLVVDSVAVSNMAMSNGHIANGHGPGSSGKNGFRKHHNEENSKMKPKPLNGFTNHKRPSVGSGPNFFNRNNSRSNGEAFHKNNSQCYAMTSIPIPAHSKLLRQGSVSDTPPQDVADLDDRDDLEQGNEESLLTEIETLLNKTFMPARDPRADYDVTTLSA